MTVSQPTIIGIRFQPVGKVYHFDASSQRDLKLGDFVVVETTRGRQLGEVVQFVVDPPPPPDGTWKPIARRANPRDLILRQIMHKKEIEAMIHARARLAEVRIPGVKIAAAEFTFDGKRLSLLYSTENDGKVDLRSVRSAMQRLYPRAQVEMRPIGPRDVAKILGGMGACGLENRCCSAFLTEFSPISIKMAKEQGISLTPEEITGMCGRLRCCLVYEYEHYVAARKSLPKRNKRVVTPQGEGRVLNINPLKDTVYVELDTGVRQEYPRTDLQPWDELEALRRKAQAPCDKHAEGGCDCGKSAPPAVPAADDAYADYDLGGEALSEFYNPEDAGTTPPPPTRPHTARQHSPRPPSSQPDGTSDHAPRKSPPDERPRSEGRSRRNRSKRKPGGNPSGTPPAAAS
jgi:cell fate regulator YaaT (PSP1 superfamily)